MTITTSLKTILEDTASAITGDPGLAAVRFAADCKLVGVTEVDVRLHNRVVKADQPPVLGGNDVGPKPVEIALAALGSCQAMTYRFWSEKLGIHIDKLTIDVQGDLDLHGIFGLRDGVRPGFGNVSVNVRITGPETPERYEELRQAVNNHCPVLDVFTNPVSVTTAMATAATVSTSVDLALKARGLSPVIAREANPSTVVRASAASVRRARPAALADRLPTNVSNSRLVGRR